MLTIEDVFDGRKVAVCAGGVLAGRAGDRDFSGADEGWGEEGF